MHPPTFPGLIAVLVTALTIAFRTEDERSYYAACAEASKAFGALMRLIAERAPAHQKEP